VERFQVRSPQRLRRKDGKREAIPSLPVRQKIDLFRHVDFFIHCESNGISSAVRLYIIKGDISPLYLITPLGVHEGFSQ